MFFSKFFLTEFFNRGWAQIFTDFLGGLMNVGEIFGVYKRAASLYS